MRLYTHIYFIFITQTNKLKTMTHIKVNIENSVVKVTPRQLAEAIADTYNTRTAGWDYQHCGQSRNYEAVEDMTHRLECTLFCANDVIDAVNTYAPDTTYLDDAMTIDEWSEMVAHSVAQRITKNQYGDVTFIITLKK